MVDVDKRFPSYQIQTHVFISVYRRLTKAKLHFFFFLKIPLSSHLVQEGKDLKHMEFESRLSHLHTCEKLMSDEPHLR